MVDFAAINARADARKATHQQRMSDLTRAHYDAHPERAAGIDVESRCWSGWWLDADLWEGVDDDWHYAGRHRPYEVMALRHIKDTAGKVVEAAAAIHESLATLPALHLETALDDLSAWWIEYLPAHQMHTYRHQTGDFIPQGDIEPDPRQQAYTFVLLDAA